MNVTEKHLQESFCGSGESSLVNNTLKVKLLKTTDAPIFFSDMQYIFLENQRMIQFHFFSTRCIEATGLKIEQEDDVIEVITLYVSLTAVQ